MAACKWTTVIWIALAQNWLHHRILGLVNGTTVRQPPAPPQHFGNCDHQDASSEDRKDKSHLVPSQGCTVDGQDTLIQTVATTLLLVGLCGACPPSDFHLSSPVWSQMPNWCRRARSCFTAVLFAKPRMLCWRYAFTQNTLRQMPKPSGWLHGRTGHYSVFSRGKLFRIKRCWISKYSLFILTFQLTPTEGDRYKHFTFYGKWTTEKTCHPIIWYQFKLEKLCVLPISTATQDIQNAVSGSGN